MTTFIRDIKYDLVEVTNAEFKPLQPYDENENTYLSLPELGKKLMARDKLAINIKNLGVYHTDHHSEWYVVDRGEDMSPNQLNKTLDKMIRQLILEVKFYSDDGKYLNRQNGRIYQYSLEYLVKMAVITDNKYLSHLMYMTKHGYANSLGTQICPARMELARREMVNLLLGR
jgi:hypothetical protein